MYYNYIMCYILRIMYILYLIIMLYIDMLFFIRDTRNWVMALVIKPLALDNEKIQIQYKYK